MDVVFDEAQLRDYLIARTKEVWETSNQPYYLANVQPELSKISKSYKSVIGEKTLSQFAGEIAEVRVVRDENQRARIGIVPAGEAFDFETSEKASRTKEAQPASRGRVGRQQETVIDFLSLLSTLSDQELEGFVIPAKVLAKLLRK
jgi:hypothetical protein